MSEGQELAMQGTVAEELEAIASEGHDADPYAHLPEPVEPPSLRVMDEDFQEVGSLTAIGALYEALARAQAAFATIAKNRTAKIQSSKGSYSFDFADLETVLAAIRPALNAEGIAVLQPPAQIKPGVVRLRTILAKGEARLVSVTTFSYEGDIKAYGGQVTYHRRYHINGFACVSADHDADDGPSESELSGTSGPRRPPLPPEGAAEAPSRPPSARAAHAPPPVGTPQPRPSGPPTDGQKAALAGHVRRLGWAPARVNQECRAVAACHSSELTAEKAAAFLRHLDLTAAGTS